MTAVRLDTLQCVQQKMPNILKKDWFNQSFFIYAWRDCLDLFALNVPTCFAFVISSLGKSTPHLAHSFRTQKAFKSFHEHKFKGTSKN